MAFLIFVTVAAMFYVEAAAVDCPSGWLVHADNCYLFSHDREEWIGARLICQSFGADLVEIETDAENGFLKNEANNLSATFWLGGNDLQEEGMWIWAHSGSSIEEYTSWKAGEPNNSANDENCMMMSTYVGWNDDACSTLWRYICEKDGSGTQIVG